MFVAWNHKLSCILFSLLPTILFNTEYGVQMYKFYYTYDLSTLRLSINKSWIYIIPAPRQGERSKDGMLPGPLC
jgi:hypothetical protein